jgi:hypothetical protein
MRRLLVLFVLAITAFGLCQSPSVPAGTAVRPQVVVYIREHATGANMVEISMVEPGYPPELLQKQITDLCRRLNAEPLGLNIYQEELVANQPNLRFLKATFAVVGLTDMDGGVNLTPLLQAFAGAPSPNTVKGMMVVLDEFVPIPKKTLRNFKSHAVEIQGRVDQNPPAVQYDIQFLTQNPGEINVLTEAGQVEKTPVSPPARKSPSTILWTLIVLAGLSMGALVYFLISRWHSGSSSASIARRP